MTEAKAPMDGNQERPPEEVVSVLGMEEPGNVSPGGTTAKGEAWKKHCVCEKDLGRVAGASRELGRQKMSSDRPCAWATAGTLFGFDSKVEFLEGFQLRSDVFQLIFRNDHFGSAWRTN